MVYGVRSSATVINQGICIKRFVYIDDGNRGTLKNGEKIFGNLSMTAALNCGCREDLV